MLQKPIIEHPWIFTVSVTRDDSQLHHMSYHIETHLTYSARQLTGIRKNVLQYNMNKKIVAPTPRSIMTCPNNTSYLLVYMNIAPRPAILYGEHMQSPYPNHIEAHY